MGEAGRKKAKRTGSAFDPAFQKRLFTQAFEQTRKMLDDPQRSIIQALIATYRGRNQTIDATAATYGRGTAECQAGCSSCCHQMVFCTPFEVFAIARHLLENKAAAKVDGVKARFARLAGLPPDPNVRYGTQNPCALLEKTGARSMSSGHPYAARCCRLRGKPARRAWRRTVRKKSRASVIRP